MIEPIDWIFDLDSDNDEEAPGARFNEDFESSCYGEDEEED